MHLERLTLQNFQGFGPVRETIRFSDNLTTFLGGNATGKTSASQAILRLFSVVSEQRTVRVEDFHVPAAEVTPPPTRELRIEAVFAFPELTNGAPTSSTTVPEFFRQMSVDDDGILKLRILLEATWTADGSVNGSIDTTRRIIFTFDDQYADQYAALGTADRNRIQAVYVPATRQGSREVGAFLRGRVWKASQWSPKFRQHVEKAATKLTKKFKDERVVKSVTSTIATRWGQLHHLPSDANPVISPISSELSNLVTNAEIFFEPSTTGRPRSATELSDGQQSLLHIAMTAATLDLESAIARGRHKKKFDLPAGTLPTLTLLIIEEPENNLSPFFLSRIVDQLLSISRSGRAQAVMSSHSASVVARINPENIRHFRLSLNRTTITNEILMPSRATDAGKFLRQAVRSYPELYFARFVVLGEGDSESVVLPLLAAARGIHIDKSFVAVVPLGGRHTNHMWKLLDQLGIPHATLLDLDYGRAGGGEGRIRDACTNLKRIGKDPLAGTQVTSVKEITRLRASGLRKWMDHLERWNIFFSAPLDLDMTLLQHHPDQYKKSLAAGSAPVRTGDPADSVLGAAKVRPRISAWKKPEMVEDLFWYRYLFQTNSKPNTHLQVLSRGERKKLAKTDARLSRLIDVIGEAVGKP